MPYPDRSQADRPDEASGTSALSPQRLAIGIATRGRREILTETLRQIRFQTRPPDRIVVCHTVAQDIAGLEALPGLEFVASPPGLPLQRNAILDRLDDCDVVLFLDDDFLMAPRYVAATLAAMQADPEIVVTTGDIIADGIKGPGLDPAVGRAMIEADLRRPARDGIVVARHGYGCNMAIRLDAARRHNVRFDERLPLYAWSEDVDYTHRLGRHGRIVKLQGARGVHLGTKQGRGSGHRLGYSQVANPIYLFHKGSYTMGRAARSVGRNLAANLMKSIWPEPHIDRRGRLRGNARAIADIVQGRLAPERVLEL